MPRTYKKISEAPPELAAWIRAINSLPCNYSELERKISQLVEHYEFTLSNTFGIETKSLDDLFRVPNELLNRYEAKLRSLLPTEFANNLFEGLGSKGFLEAAANFQLIPRYRSDLLSLLRLYEVSSEMPIWGLVDTRMSYRFNDDSTVAVKIPGIIELIIRERIPVNRIRKCLVCRCIYWAKKKNSETCGRTYCSNTLGNRKRLAEARELEKRRDQHFQSRVLK